MIVVSEKTAARLETLGFTGKVLVAEELVQHPVNEKLLKERRGNTCDIDPLYAIFTSGSTGVPKGV